MRSSKTFKVSFQLCEQTQSWRHEVARLEKDDWSVLPCNIMELVVLDKLKMLNFRMASMVETNLHCTHPQVCRLPWPFCLV